MKKIITLALALCLLFALAGCKSPEPAAPSYPEPETAGEHLRAEFVDYLTENPEAPAREVINALLHSEQLPFACVSGQNEPGFLMGFTEDITGFTDAASMFPMIGTIPFACYVFEVEGDAEAFAQNLEQVCDLRWNICTEAEEYVTGIVGNKVFFVMTNKSFEE